jgi:hypothetical protein
VIGLALQETLGNLAAGVAIQVEQPVGVGDWIRLEKGDVLGRVVNMNWRAVTIETDDRSVFVIPNGVFSKTAFMNYSRPGGLMRRNLYITVPYDVSPSVVQDAIESACRDCKDILLEPSPSVLTWNFTERGIIYWLRYWISDFNRRDSTQADIYKRVWYQFHRRKIPHALPGSHMFMHKMDGKAREEREAEVIMDRRSAIDTVDFLRPLSEKGKSTLAERGHRRLFSTGEKILHQGDVGRTFYMVRRGQVAVTVDGIEARSLGPGEFFGELALLTGRERHASVVAKAETEVFEIDEVMFRDVLKDEPEIAETVSAIVAKRQAEIASLRAAEGKPTPNDVKNMSAEILRKLKTLFAID